MSRFASLPRPLFNRPATPENANTRTARALSRRTALLHEADAILTHVPGPGEALHALITGRYNLMHVLLALLSRVGPAKTIRIATLSYNAKNLAEMFALLDGPAPPVLTLLCSAFFRDHNKAVWEETVTGFRQRKNRCAAARSHAKVITLETVTGVKFALEGSANLRSNGNREQFLLCHDAGLHDFHAGWIDQLVSEHEGENEVTADGEDEG